MSIKSISLVGFVIILLQFFLFNNYLFQIESNQILIKGQRCTCPHARVIRGQQFLKSITPDSLLIYNLDYKEVYFENEISTAQDPMGVYTYEINAEVVGKATISAGDPHYFPILHISNYNEVGLKQFFSWTIRVVLILEFVFLIALIVKFYRKKRI